MRRHQLTPAGAGSAEGDQIEGSVIAFGAAGEVSAWFIASGRVAGITMSGLALISASGPAAGRRPLLLIDEQATPEQLQILLDLFGHSPPPTYYQVPVSHTADGDEERVAIPHRARLQARVSTTAQAQASALTWPGVQWAPAVGIGWVRIVEHDLSWDADGRPAARGTFRYGISGC